MEEGTRKNLKKLIKGTNSIDKSIIQGKKQQTDNKIKLVKDYVIRWLYVQENRSQIKSINYIDVMSNAGVYDDCDLGTSMEVLQVFYESARRHPNKKYTIYINDINDKRIETAKKVTNILLAGKQKLDNLQLITSTFDVNERLADYDFFDNKLGDFHATILFVDPYNFGTVQINKIKQFIKRYYCEFIFIFFVSDYVRNNMTKKIAGCIEPEYVDQIETNDDLICYVQSTLKCGHISHVFSYTFKNSNNVELYQMVFGTPSDKGLEKLKDSIWEVFRGSLCYRTTNTTEDQLSLFDPQEEKNQRADVYKNEAITLLCETFAGQTVCFNDIAVTVEENTLLGRNHIINYVIRPMINMGLVIKNDKYGKRNYTKDNYTFKG